MNAEKQKKELLSNKLTVSAKELVYLRDCEGKFDFSRTGILNNGFETKKFLYAAIDYLKRLLWAGEGEIEEKIDTMFQAGYQKSWFDCEAQWEANYERDRNKLLRLYRYLKDFELVAINVEYKYVLPNEFCYKQRSIEVVKGIYDIILKKDDCYYIVAIKDGEPKYSYQARNRRNQVEYSIELLLMYLSYHASNQKIIPEVWYLKNKDDRGGELIDTFNHRKGKNIISYDFFSYSQEELIAKLLESLSFEEENRKCQNCLYFQVCKLNQEIRQEGKKEPSAPQRDISACSYTEDQKQVIYHYSGPMNVIAVPGAGKTASLVARMQELIKKGVNPQEILFVTFSNKAAEEIKERVKLALGGNRTTKMPEILTYNALGFSILKNNPMYIGKRVKLATETDTRALILKALNESNRIKKVSYSGIYEEYGLIRLLETWFHEIERKGEEVFSQLNQESKDVKGILEVYHTFCTLYEAAGCINYDMQISLVNELFSNYPVLARKYANRYPYIMVDEFQDSTEEQVQMIYAMARYHNNLVVVGDDDQSIYRWRGGFKEYLLQFADDFPQAKTVFMKDNFRSNGSILKASEALIEQNPTRFEKKLISHEEDGLLPIYIKGTDLSYLKFIISSALSKGYKPGDIAVLSRKNASLLEVESVIKEIVPVNLPKDYMIEDSVFLLFYHILNLYFNKMEDVSFYFYLSFFGAKEYFVKEDREITFYENLVRKGVIFNGADGKPVQIHGDSNEMKTAIQKLIDCFKLIERKMLIQKDLADILFKLKGISEHPVINNLEELANEKGIVRMEELYLSMRNMILFHDKKRVGYEVSADAVNLLTCHDSKGKEFPMIIVYGMEEFQDNEDDICLLYVAMTRAKKNLVLFESPYNHCEVSKYFQDYIAVQCGNLHL